MEDQWHYTKIVKLQLQIAKRQLWFFEGFSLHWWRKWSMRWKSLPKARKWQRKQRLKDIINDSLIPWILESIMIYEKCSQGRRKGVFRARCTRPNKYPENDKKVMFPKFGQSAFLTFWRYPQKPKKPAPPLSRITLIKPKSVLPTVDWVLSNIKSFSLILKTSKKLLIQYAD